MKVHSDISQLPDFQRTVITIGSFDGVHAGHRKILEQVGQLARAAGAESVVITFDPHPRTVLGQVPDSFRLISTTAEKASLLQETGVDHLVITPFTPEFAGLSAREYVEFFLLQKFHPQIIVIGYDHRFGNDRTGDLSFLQQYADRDLFTLVEIPAQEVDDITVSSSKIRRALESADLNTANRLLGSHFRLTGMVVEGNRIGRTIGFPTANMAIHDPYKLVPPTGIYAAFAHIHGVKKRAMLYIGNRPTIEGQNERRIEVNILDFDGDLYGQHLEVEVVDFIRGDKKLDGLDALKKQISDDQRAIEARLAQIEPSYSDVAIVILNYNTRSHLEKYLPSVVQYSGDARIIVADNGSPDDSTAFLKQNYPNVELIDLRQNFGFAEGYNQALKQVAAEYYVILNTDVEVTPNWLSPVIDEMRKNPQIAVAQPKILADQRREWFEHAGAAGGWVDALGYPFCRGRIFTHVELDHGQYDTAAPCFWATGAAFFIQADLYREFGGFDGDFFAHNEEIDLCWRLKRAGYSIWCFPQSVVYHLGGGTLGYESPRKAYLNFRNSLFSLMKNERTFKLLWVIPARLLLDGVAACMYLAKKQPAMIRAIWDAHMSFYQNFGVILRKRTAVAAVVKQHTLPNSQPDERGVFWGSIVFAHYIRRVKDFTKLKT